MRHSIRSITLLLQAALAACALGAAPHAGAQGKDFKVALIAGKTGALETYARETESGFMLGLEYLTKGQDDHQWPRDQGDRQGRPEQARSGPYAAG
jgi:branched-chain amino acid transport system substrate-binding protein